ncbi:MAG: endonuclease MutS2 [Clostridiales bacterium]|nr:endonuclease MutS2 [Clostridiales bacterium]
MNVYQNLEFDLILDKVAKLASFELVSECIRKLIPSSDIETVNKLLTQTDDALTVLASSKPNLAFESISEILEKAKVGSSLNPSEFLKIKASISALRSLKSAVENTDGCDSLKDITAWVRVCDDLDYEIGRTIENETEVKDGASEKLSSLRRAILRSNARLKEKLDGFTRRSEFSKYLQDNIVTLRGGRYVLPVKSECRSSVKGLVHDVSSTGATVFIEPFSIVEANNELITLKTEEANEVERILSELSKKVASNSSELYTGQDVLVRCGVIFAKAEYAKQLNACRPKINDDGRILLLQARHPLISESTIVPVDISLTDKRILLISGPNTGGKTVALKTVGLFAMLAAVGMFLPTADGSEISVFDKFYCDVGDSQSIAQSLSTFSAHVKNLAEITADMNDKSLVLLDEVGDGTDPDEGAALAIAILKKIISARSTAVVTTHFNSVKQFAMACDDISNASMQFDNINFKPTYKLVQGASGSSYALEIAESIGLGCDIISDARAALSAEKVAFDTVMREAEKLRNELYEEKEKCALLHREAEENAQKTRKIKQDYENKLAEINENVRAIIKRQADEYSEKAERIIEQIKEQLKNRDDAALFAARRAAKSIGDGIPSDEIKPIASELPLDLNNISVGTRVYVSGLNKDGVIASAVRGNKVVVAIGSIKTEVPISSLSLIASEKAKTTRAKIKNDREPENREIMLLGSTVDEATQVLDGILPDIAPRSVLRIVHGKGTGALGKGIQAYLKRQPRVKTFRYGRYGEGDTGVTIVEIK